MQKKVKQFEEVFLSYSKMEWKEQKIIMALARFTDRKLNGYRNFTIWGVKQNFPYMLRIIVFVGC